MVDAAVDQLFAQQASGASQPAAQPLPDDQSLLLLADNDDDATAMLLDDAVSDMADADNAGRLSDDDLGNLLGELFSE